MTAHLEELVEALRNELQHYGELLALLESEASESGRPPGVAAVVTALGTLRQHGAALGAARHQRLQVQSRFASSVERASDEPLRALLPEVPLEYRPLLRALGDEVDDLLTRLRERARLSHAHLHHAADQLEGLIDSVAASPGEERPAPALNA